MPKRYAVTLDLVIWARDEKHAISKAKMIANRQDQEYDNRCDVVEITEIPFASIHSKQVYKR